MVFGKKEYYLICSCILEYGLLMDLNVCNDKSQERPVVVDFDGSILFCD